MLAAGEFSGLLLLPSPPGSWPLDPCQAEHRMKAITWVRKMWKGTADIV